MLETGDSGRVGVRVEEKRVAVVAVSVLAWDS